MEEKVVTDVIDLMKGHFGDLVATRGREHYFPGMNIKLNDDNNIEIGMVEQLREAGRFCNSRRRNNK